MFKIVIKLIVFILLSNSLFAKDGLSQNHLLSVSSELSSDSVIEIRFDLPIIEDSLSKRTIVVKSKNTKVKGSVSVKNKNTLTFTPTDALRDTSYKVKVKPLKLLDLNPKNKTKFQKMAYKMCSWFYEDVTQCRLYKSAHTLKTKKIKFTLDVKDTQVKIISLKLNKTNISLADDSITTIDAIALYDDNTSKTLTNEVEWLIGDASIISLDKKTITPLKEGTTTLQAKYNKQESQIINVEIYKEINGYKLPPMPDKTLNNSTLLGIDVNDNGVRDDVERWIYIEYKDKHPVHIDIAMQAARDFKLVLETPEKALEITSKVDSSMVCSWYYKYTVKNFNESIVLKHFTEKIYFNTDERYKTYDYYDSLLSGGVYALPRADEEKSFCDFNTSKYEN